MAGINPFQPPMNYAIDVQSPFEAALGGFKLGAAGAEVQAQTQAREKAKTYQTGIDAFFKKPAAERTYSDIEPLLVGANKQQFDALQAVAKNMNDEQLNSSKRLYGQLLVSLEQNPETAKTILQNRIDAETNPQQKLAWQDMLKTINISPKIAADNVELLGTAAFGKDWYEGITKVREERRTAALAPSKLIEARAKADQAVADATTAQATAGNAAEKATADAAKAMADAQKAAVDAKFTERKEQAEIDKSAAVIRKSDADIIINRENARIAALNAAQAKETNVLRRDELRQKIDDAKDKRDTADRDQRATLASQSADIDNFINTAEQIKRTPISIIKSATGPIASRLPTTNQDVADFEALVETLGSQAFIAQIPKIKGTGTLTEKEGDKLQASLQNLSLKQSPSQLIANVTEAVRLMEIARVNIAARAGLPALPSDVPAKQEVFVPLPDGTRIKFPNQAAADAYKKAAGIK
jgi:hypothetical protein